MLVYICKWLRLGGFVNPFVDVKNLMCLIHINLVFVNVFCGEFSVRYLMSNDLHFFKYLDFGKCKGEYVLSTENVQVF